MTQPRQLHRTPPADDDGGVMQLGGYLREARTARRWTAQDVASAANISAQYLSDLENGRRRPSRDVACALASVLTLDRDYTLFLADYWPARFKGLDYMTFNRAFGAFCRETLS